MADPQTSTHVSAGTVEALNAIAAARSTSRDRTARELLEAHVERQEAQVVAERRSHVSTLLRFPMRPFARSAPFPGSRLPLRLPRSLAARAVAAALTLPGQPPGRGGPRDYQARRLGDAITTAVALGRPITDPELRGFLPLLRHRSAESLWRLAVAGTLTRAERAAHQGEGLSAQTAARASGLGDLDDPTFARVRAALPRGPGLYLWTAAPDGAWSGRSIDRAVIYLGRATGAGGLQARLGDELRWVRNGAGRSAAYRQANYHGHPRTMLTYDARALYATTADTEQAAELERELLAVAAFACALSPLANGGSWWSSTERQRGARQRGYDRLAAAGLLVDPAP